MAYFAKIDENNIVVQVIVADQAFIDSGAVGDPASWIETKKDGSIRGRYAGKGKVYDPSVDKFKPPKPYESWTYNETEDQWEAPIQEPNKPLKEDENWRWAKIPRGEGRIGPPASGATIPPWDASLQH